MTEDAIGIREFREHDLEAIVEFSLRAWQPIFASAREVLGDDIFLRLHPDWKANQADAVRSTCTNDAGDVFVSLRSRLSTCEVAAWTSPSSKLAATPGHAPVRAAHTESNKNLK